jgi:pilus assembly protein CpaE
MRAQAGQASVELLGTLPAALLVGLFCFQLLAVGYAAALAGGAAEAGALAAAAGTDPREAVRESLPGWSRARASVEVGEQRVEVRLRPPSPLRMLADRLEVEASASVGE